MHQNKQVPIIADGFITLINIIPKLFRGYNQFPINWLDFLE